MTTPGTTTTAEKDTSATPEDLRLAYRILKNAGFVPDEVRQINEAAQLERLISEGNGDCKAARKLALLKTRIESAYYDKVLRRLR